MRCRVSSATGLFPDITCETVVGLTPADSAIERSVGAR